jgi:hypothetical protein
MFLYLFIYLFAFTPIWVKAKYIHSYKISERKQADKRITRGRIHAGGKRERKYLMSPKYEQEKVGGF